MPRQPDSVKHDLVHRGKEITLPYSEVVVGGDRLRYSHSGRMSRKRVDTLLEKEPTTLPWLETFAPSDVFWDVGANVGMYTVYAAVRSKCKVFAFEPESLNYAELNKNIHLNGIDDRVRAYCCGISNRSRLETLYLSTFANAFSHHDCGENRWEGPVTRLGPSADARPKQGIMALSLDDVFHAKWIDSPTHIKIDVDGLEWQVVAGAEDLIEDCATLKTVLVETDFKLPKSVEIIKYMTSRGWKYSMDQVCTTRTGMLTPDEWETWVRTGKGGCNIIYFKDERYRDLFARVAKETWGAK